MRRKAEVDAMVAVVVARLNRPALDWQDWHAVVRQLRRTTRAAERARDAEPMPDDGETHADLPADVRD